RPHRDLHSFPTRRSSDLISLQHVYKSFDGKEVLHDLSIDVERGESVVIVGGSGTGKSVTLKHIIGLLKPDRGRIFVDGEEINVRSEEHTSELQSLAYLVC